MPLSVPKVDFEQLYNHRVPVDFSARVPSHLDRTLFSPAPLGRLGFVVQHTPQDAEGREWHRLQLEHDQLFRPRGATFVRRAGFNTRVTRKAKLAAKERHGADVPTKDIVHVVGAVFGCAGTVSNTEVQRVGKDRTELRKLQLGVFRAFRAAGPSATLYVERLKDADGLRTFRAEVVKDGQVTYSAKAALYP